MTRSGSRSSANWLPPASPLALSGVSHQGSPSVASMPTGIWSCPTYLLLCPEYSLCFQAVYLEGLHLSLSHQLKWPFRMNAFTTPRWVSTTQPPLPQNLECLMIIICMIICMIIELISIRAPRPHQNDPEEQGLSLLGTRFGANSRTPQAPYSDAF